MNTSYLSSVDRPVRWSLGAGLYMFICAIVAALLLSDLLTVLVDVIGLETEYWMIVLAGPALTIGMVVWWAAVERRDSYTYALGGGVGLVTALLTGLLWTIQFILVWGVEMAAVPMVAVLIAIVLGLAAIAGLLTGISLMYARRRLNSELPSGRKRTN